MAQEQGVTGGFGRGGRGTRTRGGSSATTGAPGAEAGRGGRPAVPARARLARAAAFALEQLEARQLLSITTTIYDNTDLTGPSVRRIDNGINFNWGQGSPDPRVNNDAFSARWTGQVLTQNYAGAYTFSVRSDDGCRLWINNQLIIDKWQVQSQQTWSGTITLAANTRYDLKLEYFDGSGGASAELYWSRAGWAQTLVYGTNLFADAMTVAPGAPSGLTATAASPTRVNLAWSAGTNASSYAVERSEDGGANFTQVAVVDATSTSYADLDAQPGTAYAYRVRSYNGYGSNTNTVGTYSAYAATATATAPAVAGLPAGWTARNVNFVGIDGTTAYNAATGAFALGGAGVGIDYNADSFRFAYRSLTGDGQVIARVTGLTGGTGAKAGVMFRDGLTPGALSALMAITPSAGATFATRAAASGLTTSTAGTGAAPYWVKLVRSGSSFSGYVSADGGTWTQVGATTTVAMGSTVYVGLADTSAAWGTNNSASFDAVTVMATPAAAPAAPGSLAAVAAGTTAANLTWADNSDNEQAFQVERKTGGGGTYALVGTVTAGVTAYADAGLTPGTTYYYRVRATNAGGNSAYAPEVAVTTSSNLPAAPSGLALSNPTTTTIQLAWADNSSNETGFKVEVSTDGGTNYGPLATTAANATSYTAAGLTPGLTYWFRVRATNAAGDSAATAAQSLATKLLAPTGLTAAGTTSTRVDLAWLDNAANETGYQVERKTGAGGTYAPIATAAAGATAFADLTAQPGTTYYYRVRAVNGASASDYAPEVSAATPGAVGAPTNLAATNPTTTSVDLAWTDTASNETGFAVEASAGGGAFAQVGTSGANQTSYTVTGLTPGVAYAFRVRAYNAAEASAYSGTASAATKLVAPTGLTATASPTSGTRVDLAWADASANETGFAIERRAGAGGTYALLTTTAAGVTSFADLTAAADTTYYYRVRAVNAASASDYAPEATATTQAPGDGLAATYWPRADFGGTPVARADAQVDFHWASGQAPAAGIPAAAFAAEWRGSVRAPAAGTYAFGVEADGAVRLWVGGQLIVDRWAAGDEADLAAPAAADAIATVTLAAGQRVPVRLEYRQAGGPADVRLTWVVPGSETAVAVPAQHLFADATGLPAAPTAPTTVRASMPAGGLSVGTGLAIGDATGATHYEVYRTDPAGGSGAAAEDRGGARARANGNDSNLTDAHALGTRYRYTVVAVGPGGRSAPVDVVAPLGPVTARAGARRVELSFAAPAGGASAVAFDRSDDGGLTWTPIGAVHGDAGLLTDLRSVEPGHTYVYRTFAVAPGAWSAPVEVSVTTPAEEGLAGGGTTNGLVGFRGGAYGPGLDGAAGPTWPASASGLTTTFYNSVTPGQGVPVFVDHPWQTWFGSATEADLPTDGTTPRPESPLPVGVDKRAFSTVMTGVLTDLPASPTGVYRFRTTAHGGVRVWVDGRLVIDSWAVAPRMHGDATLDGLCNLDDLVALANHYGLDAGVTWAGGDFTGDGAVNLDDLVDLANHYGQTQPPVTTVGQLSLDGTRDHTLRVEYFNQALGTGVPLSSMKLEWAPDDGSDAFAVIGQDHLHPVAAVRPPVVRLGAAGSKVTVGQPYTLNLSYDDPDGEVAVDHVRIDWGDGYTEIKGGAPTSVGHTYDRPGQYTVSVTPHDADLGADLPAVTGVTFDATFGEQGKLWTQVGGAADDPAALARDAQGRVVTVSDDPATGEIVLRRHLADGTPDDHFGTVPPDAPVGTLPGGTARLDLGTAPGTGEHYAAHVAAMSVGADGHIYLAGDVYTASGAFDFLLVRLTADGELDPSFGDPRGDGTHTGFVVTDFGTTMHARANALAVDPSTGAITLAGFAGGDLALARYAASGVIDGSFGTGGTRVVDLGTTADIAYAAKVDSAGRILVAGRSGDDMAVARFTAGGDLDPTFGTGGKRVFDVGTRDHAYDLALDLAGRVYVVGEADGTFAVARLTATGQLDGGFDTDGWLTDARFAVTGGTGGSYAWRVQATPDGGAVVAGATELVADPSATGIVMARYTATGEAETSFGQAGVARWTDEVDHLTNVKALDVFDEAGGKFTLAAAGLGAAGYDVALLRVLASNWVTVVGVNPAPILTAVSDPAAGYAEGDSFTVGLSATQGGTADPIDHWVLHVGGRDVTVAGNPSTFALALPAGDALTITADAVGIGGDVYHATGTITLARAVTGADADTAEVGELVRLTVPGGAVAGTTYVWNVSAGDRPYASGTGMTFEFTPDAAGTYYVTTYAQVGGGAPTVLNVRTIAVVDVAPRNVRITGPAAGPFGRVAVFTATARAVSAGPVQYQWGVDRLIDNPDQGDTWLPITLPPGTATDLPTFRFVPGVTDTSGGSNVTASYRVRLSVTNSSGQATLAERRFSGVSTNQAFLSGVAQFSDSGVAEPFGIAVQPDGKIVLAGTATYSDSEGHSHAGFAIARFNPGRQGGTDSSGLVLDTSFGGGDGMVITDFDPAPMAWYPRTPAGYAVALMPDGRIIVAGEVTRRSADESHSAAALVAYTADGTPDTTFGPLQPGSDTLHAGVVVEDFGGWAGARALIVQPDGKVVISGWYQSLGDITQGASGIRGAYVARYGSDGTPDTSFGDSGRVTLRPSTFDSYDSPGLADPTTNLDGLALQADGKIVAVGWANTTDSPHGKESEPIDPDWRGEDFLVVRLNSDGTPDDGTAGPGGDSTPDDRFGDAGNGGMVTTDLGHDPNSSAFPGWKKDDFATTVVVQPNGKLLVGGWTGLVGVIDAAVNDLAMVRYNDDGTLDHSFGMISSEGRTGKVIEDVGGNDNWFHGDERIVDMGLQADGRIIAAAGWDPYPYNGYLARFNANGTPDNTFDEDFGFHTGYIFGSEVARVNAFAVGLDGMYVAAFDPAAGGMTLTRFATNDALAINLTAAARPDGTIDLRWQDVGDGEDGFAVQRWDPGIQSFIDVGYVGADVTTYTDTDVTPGVTYRYRINAFSGVDDDGNPVVKGTSNEASATVPFAVGSAYRLQETVRVPVNGVRVVTKTDLADGGSYVLQASGYFKISPDDDWGGPKRADAEYGLFKRAPFDRKPYPWYIDYGLAVGDKSSPAGPAADRGVYWGPLATDADHTYRAAYVGTGAPLELWYRDDMYGDNERVPDGLGDTKPYEMLVDVYRLIPPAPTHLTAAPDPTGGKVRLAWQATDDPAVLWTEVVRSVDGGPLTLVKKLPAGVTTYTDEAAVGHRYAYQVRLHTAADDSPYSNPATTALVADRPLALDAIPAQAVAEGRAFVYRAHAADPDEPWLKVTYSLSGDVPGGPSGMTVNDGGYISWLGATAGAPRTITVRAARYDNAAVFVERTFTLTVGAAPAQPLLGDATGTVEAPNRVRLTTTLAQRVSPDGLTYTWAMIAGPDGAKAPVFSAANGSADGADVTATFAPGSLVGTYLFRVTATDASGAQDVAVAGVTLAPVVTTLRIRERNRGVPQNAAVTFSAFALDQFGREIEAPELTWTVDGGPGLSDHDTSVVVQTGNVAGAHTLRVTSGGVTDAALFYNDGTPDAWPVIGTVTARPDPEDASKVWLTADATDDAPPPAGLTYTWSLVDGPGTVTFDNSGVGRRVSATFTASGDYEFEVAVSDGATHAPPAGTAPPTRRVTFRNVRVLTSLAITPAAVNVAPGGVPVTLTVTGLDQFGDPIALGGGVATWALDGAGTGASTVDNQYIWTPPATADGTAVLTATIGSVTGSVPLAAVAPHKPVVRIVSPVAQQRAEEEIGGVRVAPKAPIVDPAKVDRDTAVYVQVDDPNDDPVTWRLRAVPADGGAPIDLASGSGELGVNDAAGQKVADLHPLALPQGLYTLELIADDGTVGAASVDRQQFVVSTPLKLGNLNLPVTDMTVQGLGLPITIGRAYDSSRANKYDGADPGDFGPGWRLTTADTDLRVTASATRRVNALADAEYPAYFPGDVVYLTLPDGQTESFEFAPQYLGAYNPYGLHYTYKPAFKALGGSTSRLTVAWGDNANGELDLDPTTGELNARTANGLLAFNPARNEFGRTFLLTTKDGTQYDIDAKTGMIRTVTDPNHNVLKYTLDGRRVTSIASYNEANIGAKTVVEVVRREGDHRIERITDTSTGRSILYEYDASFPDAGDSSVTHVGELMRVTNRAGDTTTYGYSRADRLEYHLTSVTDPRGLVVLSATYDPATGQLTALKDPYKKAASVGNPSSYDGGSARQSVTDPAGNKTEEVYDFRGRVVREIKQVKNAAGTLTGYLVTVTRYDDFVDENEELGGISKVTNYLPFTVSVQAADTRYTLEPSQVSSTTSFDRDGNVTGQTDGAGRATSYAFPAVDGDEIKPADAKPTSTTDAYGNTTHFTYDPTTGNLTSSTDSAGQTTLYEYDARGNTVGTYLDRGDPGRDADDVPLSQSEYDGPRGQVTSTKSDFRLNNGTWVAMSERQYTYGTEDIDGQSYRKETVTLFWRDTVTGDQRWVTESETVYDAEDRVWKSTDINHQTTATVYNAVGQVAETIDPFGGHTRYDYDVRGNVIRTAYPDGTETRTAYDALGRAEWQTDRYAVNASAGGAVDNLTRALATQTVYDDLGRVVATRRYQNVLVTVGTDTSLDANPGGAILRADATGGTLVSSTATEYDAAGRAWATIDAAGLRTETTFGPDGRVKNVRQMTKLTAPTAGTSYAYDYTSGGLHQQDRVTDALGHHTTTDYDAQGRPTTVTYEDGSFTQTFYGVGDHPVNDPDVPLPTSGEAGQPDEGWAGVEPGGRHEVRVAQHADGVTITAALETHYVYDRQGRLTDVWLPPVKDDKVDSPTHGQSVRPHWHYTYDGRGNQLTQTDPLGHTTTFAYDSRGNRTSRELPHVGLGPVYTETSDYDPHGRLAAHTDFKGQRTTYVYDDTPAGGGRLAEERRFAAGNATTTPDERTAYGYDALGRVAQVTEYAGLTRTRQERTTYDPVTGGVATVTTPEGVVNHDYDPATGRLTRTWTGADPANPTTSTLYGYDELGRLKSVASERVAGSAPAAPRAHLDRYDAAGRVLVAGGANDLPTTVYEYDAVGDLDKVALPNGVVEDYDYDALNRLTALTVKNDGQWPLFTQSYHLEADGKRDYVIEKRYGGASATAFSTTKVDWAYDADGRLTGEARDEGAGDLPNGGDGAMNFHDYADGYAYDLNGNRVLKTHAFYTGSAVQSVRTAYQYDDNGDDRLMSEGPDLNLDGVPDVGTKTSYTYDANGSQLTVITGPPGGPSTSARYNWDLRNRLAAVDANGDGDLADAGDAAVRYDSRGQRVSEERGGEAGTQFFVNDHQNPTRYPQVIEERVSTVGSVTTVARSYTVGLTTLGQADAGTSFLYLVRDGHGSSRTQTDADGTPGGSCDYDAFGMAVGFDPKTAGSSQLFAGDAEFDGSGNGGGLYYHDARWRNGFRFLSVDPHQGTISDPLSLHRYGYAAPSPIMASDPSGLFTRREGYEAERQIQAIYKMDHLGDTITFGKWTQLPGMIDLKPDILNTSMLAWLDIKPLSPSGIIDAGSTITKYSPLLTFGYLPEFRYEPSQTTIMIFGKQHEIFQSGGIIFYTDPLDTAEDLLAAATALSMRFLSTKAFEGLLSSAWQGLSSFVKGGVAATNAERGEGGLGAASIGTLIAL